MEKRERQCIWSAVVCVVVGVVWTAYGSVDILNTRGYIDTAEKGVAQNCRVHAFSVDPSYAFLVATSFSAPNCANIWTQSITSAYVIIADVAVNGSTECYSANFANCDSLVVLPELSQFEAIHERGVFYVVCGIFLLCIGCVFGLLYTCFRRARRRTPEPAVETAPALERSSDEPPSNSA